MIEKVRVLKVNGRYELAVTYKSGKVKLYTKDEKVAHYTRGITMVPKTVIDFMRKNPNKVTF